MNMSSITTALDGIGVQVYAGYPVSGAKLPYIVHRPILIDPSAIAIDGGAILWDSQYAIYCCGASVEASYNLALTVMSTLQGKRIGGYTTTVSMGYSGALTEGQYESQVTIQILTGSL